MHGRIPPVSVVAESCGKVGELRGESEGILLRVVPVANSQLPEGVVVVSGAAFACVGVHQAADVAVAVVEVDVGFVGGGVHQPKKGSDIAGAGITRVPGQVEAPSVFADGLVASKGIEFRDAFPAVEEVEGLAGRGGGSAGGEA